MNELRITPLHSTPRTPDTPAKIRDAAQQFEALLIGQMLRMVRESGGWLGTSDSSSDCAMEYAEEQLALVMARGGGLGLADLIARGLTPQDSSATGSQGSTAQTPPPAPAGGVAPDASSSPPSAPPDSRL